MTKSLIVAKDEELVFEDGAASGEAELFALEVRNGCGGGEVERVGIEDLIAEVTEGGSVDLVGARFDGGVDDGTACATELGRGNSGGDAELLDRVGRREDDDGVYQRLVVVGAVEQEVVGLRAKAVDGECTAAAIGVAEGFDVAVDAGSV